MDFEFSDDLLPTLACVVAESKGCYDCDYPFDVTTARYHA